MKLIITIAIIFFSSQTFGQNIIVGDAEYMDTATAQQSTCKNYNLYYYQMGGKYPENSASLLNKLLEFLQDKPQSDTASGYITFRFTVNCEGQVMKKVQVLQTDEKYKRCHFQQPLVNQLFLFFNTLKKWKKATATNGESYNYFAFISFKIKHGKVINIIP